MSTHAFDESRTRRPVASLLRERLALSIFGLCVLSYTLFMIYVEHVDREFASGGIETLYAIGLFVPILLLAVALVLVALARAWTVGERFVAASLSVGWVVSVVIGSTDLGCDDIGGGEGRCAVSETSGPAEAVVLAIAAAIVIACIRLHGRALPAVSR